MSYILTNKSIYLNKVIILIFYFSLGMIPVFAQGDLVQGLTLKEKIGQLFVIPACQLRGEDHFEDLKRLIEEEHIGGIILKQGTIEGQIAFIDKLQRCAKIPLLCIQDGEWGIGMRLSDAIAFPKNLTLGAIQDPFLLFELGKEIGRQCRIVGAHLNLAPVVDVNSNPCNPVIGIRSFGEDPQQVAFRAKLFVQGIQSMGVMACAKHFPGHGNTAIDSHLNLPSILSDRAHFEKSDLFPFLELVQGGVDAVMTAHVVVPSFSKEEDLPATFSYPIITELLQEKWGFSGLIITDALNMQALSRYYSIEEIALKAFTAGHHLLLYGDHIAPHIDQILRLDVPRAIATIEQAVQRGEIPMEALDARVEKILRSKQALASKTTSAVGKVNTLEAFALKKKLFQEAVTLVGNQNMLPLKSKRIALIEWKEAEIFRATLEKECQVDVYTLLDPSLIFQLQQYEEIVLSLFGCTQTPPDFGIQEEVESVLRNLSEMQLPITAVLFANPYVLRKIPSYSTILIAYEKALEGQEIAAEILLGKLPLKGKLPIFLEKN